MLTLVVLQSYLLNKVTWRWETERRTLVWCDLRSHLWLWGSLSTSAGLYMHNPGIHIHKGKQCNLLQMPKSLTGGPIGENVRDMTYVWSLYRRECLEQQLFWQNNLVQWFQHCEIAEEAAAGGNGFLFDWQLERWPCRSQTLTVLLNMGRKRHRRPNERLKTNHYRWQHIQRTDRQTSCLWKDWIRWNVSILSQKKTKKKNMVVQWG